MDSPLLICGTKSLMVNIDELIRERLSSKPVVRFHRNIVVGMCGGDFVGNMF